MTMFCVSDRLLPTYPQQPAAIFIPPAVASMMASTAPRGQTLMTNVQPAAVPLPPMLITRRDRRTTPTKRAECYGELSPTRLKATVQMRLRETATKCTDATETSGAGATSFRIADILGWRVGSSGRRVERRAVETTAVEERRRCFVRPWDERPSSTSASSTSSSTGLEERISDDDDDDDAAEIDVEDASCSQRRTTSSDHDDVCPLGALLRMTSQTNFDDCANHLQQCFNDGRYTRSARMLIKYSNLVADSCLTA